MRQSKDGANIRKNVFDFYAKNKKRCDQCYALAESRHIDRLYRDVDNEHSIHSMLAKTSVILLTANKYERNILHKRACKFGPKQICRFEINLVTAYQRVNKVYAYWFEWYGYSILNIQANVTGSYTIGGSADIIRWILSNDYLFPTAIVSFGICFGTKESDNKLGDVVISRKVYPYFIGAKIKGKDFTVVDDNAFRINGDLENKVLNLTNNNKLKFPAFNVYFSNYITGEAVVSSRVMRDKFMHTTKQEILAGDMEGYGLFKECNGNRYSIPCVIVKSICDWGTEKNFNTKDERIQLEFSTAIASAGASCSKEALGTLKDRLQAYAADCAFNVLRVMLENEIFAPSLLDQTRLWIMSYNGLITTCKTIKTHISNMMEQSHLECSAPDSFVHKCLMILEEEKIICCAEECKSTENEEECCIHPGKDATIDIKKENTRGSGQCTGQVYS